MLACLLMLLFPRRPSPVGSMTDALQAAVAADQLALLMAVQQQQNNSNMMNLAANAAAACSNGLPLLNNSAAGFQMAGALPPQSTALPLGPPQSAVDQMQMLLSRPADLNR